MQFADQSLPPKPVDSTPATTESFFGLIAKLNYLVPRTSINLLSFKVNLNSYRFLYEFILDMIQGVEGLVSVARRILIERPVLKLSTSI